MAWLESHQELGNHPKVAKLARLLGISRPAAVGHLHYFWWWALDYARNGDVTRYDALQVATGASWDGDEALFVDALCAAGFLDRDGERLLIHDWEQYGGKSATRMEQNAARQRAFRDRHKADEPVTPRNASVTVTSPLHNALTKQNKTVDVLPDGNTSERGASAPAPAPKPIPKSRPQRLPDDWVPSAGDVAWAERKGYPAAVVDHETEKFMNHWQSTGATKADWSATWKNWLIRASEMTPPKVTPIRANGHAGRDIGYSNEDLERIMLTGELP